MIRDILKMIAGLALMVLFVIVLYYAAIYAMAGLLRVSSAPPDADAEEDCRPPERDDDVIPPHERDDDVMPLPRACVDDDEDESGSDGVQDGVQDRVQDDSGREQDQRDQERGGHYPDRFQKSQPIRAGK